MWKYLDKPSEWDGVVEAVRRLRRVGLDTETYGHNVKTSTPAYRAKIDVWSLALSTSQLSPRGYRVARACVLPLEAALYPPMKEMLESPDILHVFHNAHHDQHAFANYGIQVGWTFDTLDAVRLLWPGLDEGYSLKPLRVNILGKVTREGFKELTSSIEVAYTTTREAKVCACGEDKCRKTAKKWGAVHAKTVMLEEVEKTRKEPCPIESIVPGHVRWLRKLEYAGDDAADGLEIYDMIQRRIAEIEPKLPNLPWEIPTEWMNMPVVTSPLV